MVNSVEFPIPFKLGGELVFFLFAVIIRTLERAALELRLAILDEGLEDFEATLTSLLLSLNSVPLSSSSSSSSDEILFPLSSISIYNKFSLLSSPYNKFQSI